MKTKRKLKSKLWASRAVAQAAVTALLEQERENRVLRLLCQSLREVNADLDRSRGCDECCRTPKAEHAG